MSEVKRKFEERLEGEVEDGASYWLVCPEHGRSVYHNYDKGVAVYCVKCRKEVDELSLDEIPDPNIRAQERFLKETEAKEVEET